MKTFLRSPQRLPQRLCGWAILCLALQTASRLAAAGDYEREVKPILVKRCYACHGALKQSGGLRLDTGRAILAGGDSGPAVAPHDIDASLIVGVVTGDAGFRMPPENEGTPLSDDEIQTLKNWIERGAPVPDDEQPQEDPRQYFSYQPPTSPVLPLSGADLQWVRDPVDTFLSAKQRAEGVAPVGDAEKSVFLRRLYLDMIGLPPTEDELQAFLQDERPDAVHRVTDQLLASPLYGQRWGRHWMDVWRYSDWYGSRGGNEIRYSQRHIWRWRDWIVESLNADRGYDEMIVAMLAGDELDPGNPDVIRATGFLGRNWYKFDRNVWMFETVEQTCQAFLGLTMKCARCHDHKFDPITQKDYYQFRAFFEPHDVRTDPISDQLETEKDATLGQVLKVGVSYVYDKQPDVPTYLFARGDSRSPVKDEKLAPGVPPSLGGETLVIQPVALPPNTVAPYLRDEVLAGLRKEVTASLVSATQGVTAAEQSVGRIREQLEKLAQNQTLTTDTPLFHDDFSSPRSDVWQVVNGQWEYADGHLVQGQPGTFHTMAANVSLPTDFVARIRYRPLAAGNLHSVGLFFDATDLANCQAIYTAKVGDKATVQAFHRANGTEHYPAARIFPCEFELDQLVQLDIATRGQQLNIWVNGELKLVYTMPTPRRSGSFALWTHAAAAEFHELRFQPLPDDFVLASGVDEKLVSPLDPPTRESLEQRLQLAKSQIALAQKRVATVRAQQESLEARIAADRAKVSADSAATALAQRASSAERRALVAAAEEELAASERNVAAAQSAKYATDELRTKAVADGESKRNASIKKLETARANLAKEDTSYTALGPVYPATSSGRRLALARWIASPTNPRTSRIAVNHIWLRHFGEGLVSSVANFGLNGQRPTHPELLDWLAIDLASHNWSTKHLHRRLVTSAAYRLSSSDAAAPAANLRHDPANRWLWRMNSRRAESEVVRDTTLYLAGMLDLEFGGPEIPETTGLESRRRSLYFRSTPNERMVFLELFDQANPNECYRRQESIVPQQSLALFNSSLALAMARQVARQLCDQHPVSGPSGNLAGWVEAAFARVLSRPPTTEEREACIRFLQRNSRLIAAAPQEVFPAANGQPPAGSAEPLERAAENLVHVLFNHNDFVTIR